MYRYCRYKELYINNRYSEIEFYVVNEVETFMIICCFYYLKIL